MPASTRLPASAARSTTSRSLPVNADTFDGYAAVLIQLPQVRAAVLREAVTDGWLACTPPALAAEFARRAG
jgi:hypothetical protein